MEMSLEQNVQHLVRAVDLITKDVQTIKRGLYGDEENGTKGLIARQQKDEERLDKIELHIKKDTLRRKWFAGILAAIGAAIVEGWHSIEKLWPFGPK